MVDGLIRPRLIYCFSKRTTVLKQRYKNAITISTGCGRLYSIIETHKKSNDDLE